LDIDNSISPNSGLQGAHHTAADPDILAAGTAAGAAGAAGEADPDILGAGTVGDVDPDNLEAGIVAAGEADGEVGPGILEVDIAAAEGVDLNIPEEGTAGEHHNHLQGLGRFSRLWYRSSNRLLREGV